MNEKDLITIEDLKDKAVTAQMFEVAMALRESVKLLKQTLARIG